MEASLTTITAWANALACIAFAALALHLATRPKGGACGWALLSAAIISSAWGFLGSAFAVTQLPVLRTAAALADVIRIAAWYWFLLTLLTGPGAGQLSRLRGLAFTATALILAGILFQLIAAFDWNALGSPARLVLLDALGLSIFALVLLENLFRNIPADARWNMKPLCLGLVGAFGFDVYLYAEALLFNRLDADAMSVRALVHALVTPLIVVTAARNRGWTLTLSLSRRVVFHSTALLASGIYLIFVAAAGYYVRFSGGEWGRAIQVALMFGGILILGVLAVSGSVRAKLKVLISKHFFSYRYDYRDEWLRFTETLSACDRQAALGQQIIRGLSDLVESPAGALWVRDKIRGHFVQSARWNMPEVVAVEPSDSPCAQFLTNSGWVINLEQYRAFPLRYGELRVPSWLSEMHNAWLVVPLLSGDELIGFTVLAASRTRVDVNWEVNDLLKTAGRQAASFLARMEASEALLEASKFDAFNRMSAFVVHDLKNIIAQLGLMLKNAERHKDKPEFQQDMLSTVANTVDRMKQLMMQLREGTTPVDSPRGVDLAQTIRRIHRAKTGQEPVPDLYLQEGVMAKGHDDRLERVIGHIVQNAFDATEPTGRVWIRLEKHEEQAMVEVGDTGRGMTPEFMRERLFKPFHTTKSAGMGIGAYESYQYVQELGGRILVESVPDAGTRFRVLLPLHSSSATGSESSKAAA
jgi:putative PEP-CTERM system histidine kinase